MIVREIRNFIFDADLESKPLIENQKLVYSILFSYVAFVKWVGPWAMRGRKPFGLKGPMIAYNFMQSALNLYASLRLFKVLYDFWDLRCHITTSPSYSEFVQRNKQIFWHILLIKYADLLDTVFFVLRKKYSHVSHLHVIHHGLMCGLMSYTLDQQMRGAYAGGYFIVLSFLINTNIHIIMYFYYALAAFGPTFRKYLWWKKSVTLLQICQFLFILGYMAHGYLTGCENMGILESVIFAFVFLIFVLFVNFYRKTFKRTKKTE